MKYSVYQFHLTEKLYNQINSGQNPHAESAMSKLMMTKGENAQSNYEYAQEYFTKVCEIEAYDLDEVFEYGNVGPEDRITRVEGVDMTSVSVGNVIIDGFGNASMVCGWGFTPIVFNDRMA